MKNMFLSLIMFCGLISANAQTPVLVEDIWPGSLSSDPGPLAVHNGRLYFYANDTLDGRELFEYLNSGTGSSVLADMYPGGYGAGGPVARNDNMVSLNGKFYFPGCIAPGGPKILVYDGLNPPAVAPGLAAYYGTVVWELTALGNKLYFAGDLGTSGSSLFSYDGVNPPVLVKRFATNASGSSSTQRMAYYKGKVYFSADSSGFGSALFAYDPATSVCSMVADVNPGAANLYPATFLAVGDKLYFSGIDTNFSRKLFSYDGNSVKRLTTVQPGFLGAGPSVGGFAPKMTFYKGAFFFRGTLSYVHDALFKYDTATGLTSLVCDVNPGGDPNLSELISTANNVYFCGRTAASGLELWRYNGKTCTMVADLNPGTAPGVSISNLVAYEGGLYFNGSDGVKGNELYRIWDVPGSNAGVQNTSWSGSVSLHPNPVTSAASLDITLQSPQSLRISLTDISGREVFSTGAHLFASGKNEVRIPMQGLARGQYFYRITGNGQQTLAGGTLLKP